MGFVSYAQNYEDVLLHRVFGGTNYGFYVDIGAYHPVDDSVTKAFYDRGWSGINIEPGAVFEELAAQRPRDVNLRMAVSDRCGEIKFAQFPGWYAGLSHVLEGVEGTIAPSGQPAIETCTVACDTLTNILNIHAYRRPIAFLKIDAEGSESAIIRSTDWRSIRPTVLVIEATLPLSTELDNADWEQILIEQGYIRAYFDGINCFYLPEERAPALLHHFQVPVNVLDGAVRFDRVAIESAAERARLEPALTAAEAESASLAARLAVIEQEHAFALTKRSEHAESVQRQLTENAAWLTSAESERNALALELAALTEQRDTLAAQLDVLVARFRSLAAERDDLFARLNPAVQADANAIPGPETRTITPRKVAKRLALGGFNVIRPVLLPLACRFRAFMSAPLAKHFDDRTGSLPVLVAELRRALCELRELRSLPSVQMLPSPAPASGTEMHQLADEMERVLLTLALESSYTANMAELNELVSFQSVPASPPPVVTESERADRS